MKLVIKSANGEIRDSKGNLVTMRMLSKQATIAQLQREGWTAAEIAATVA